jgi:hypothetical protein
MSFLSGITPSRERAAKSAEAEPAGKKARTQDSHLPPDFLQTLGHYLMGHASTQQVAKAHVPATAAGKAGSASTIFAAADSMRSPRGSTAAREAGARKKEVDTGSHLDAAAKIFEQQERVAQTQPASDASRAMGAAEHRAVAEPTDAKSILLAQPALEDSALRLSVMPQSAHINIDAGGAGDLSLHLRVKDGVADVRLEGAASPLLEPKADELRVVLATEGITLGSFDVSQDGSSRHEQAYQSQDEVAALAGHGGRSSARVQDGTANRTRTGIVDIKA